MTPKERIRAAMTGGAPDRTPVFPLVMGFAAARAGLSYERYAREGSALAEAQLKFAERFPVDAITACSDAFRLSADLGGEIAYSEDQPPRLIRPVITCRADLRKLRDPDFGDRGSRCGDRALAVREMVAAAGDRLAVFGWVDFPFAEACSACGVASFMTMLADDPALAHELLRALTRRVIRFARAQLDAGAEFIGAGDAAASLISPAMFREFTLPYEREVVDAIHAGGGLVKTHVCGNASNILHAMAENGSDLYNVDHMVDLREAIRVFAGAGAASKGNLDPVEDLCRASPERARARARECVAAAEDFRSRYVLSPGCEVPAGTSDACLLAFCEAAFE